MTAEEWAVSDDLKRMLHYLPEPRSDRKLRLYATACCRLVWYQLATDDCRRAVELSERSADDPSVREALADLCHQIHEQAADARGISQPENTRSGAAFSAAWYASVGAMWHVSKVAACVQTLAARPAIASHQRALLREILGNPFRPVTADPSWLTSTVVALAQGIYADRAFDRLPILADALQDAGCENPDILDHCRGPGPHVRGCWVVDLLLGKA